MIFVLVLLAVLYFYVGSFAALTLAALVTSVFIAVGVYIAGMLILFIITMILKWIADR